MRPLRLPLLLLLGACADPGPDVEGTLRARRAALGLPPDPLTFPSAMAEMEKGAFEPLLARVGSKRLPRDEVIDAALRIENLLDRAVPEAPPREFAALLDEARRGAGVLARAAAAGGEATAEAYALLVTCVKCHEGFRPAR